MTDAERVFPDPSESAMLSAEQVESVPSRLGEIMTALRRVYGTDGRTGDGDSVAAGKVMLRDLFTDLGVDISQHSQTIEDKDWTFPDLLDYTLLPVAAITLSTKLTPGQKMDIFAQYPAAIRSSGFAFNKGGGKAQVVDKLLAMMRDTPANEPAYSRLVKDIEKRWRQDSRRRLGGALGHLIGQN